ncbi:hemoglobin subunit alpha-D isoform X1 [Pygocentrus nattereri]|uniref:Globin domain-containing protein n=1 Tax=Pygocentrus nattereri TaxID=42514 RepID=A0AAR2IQA6_PYGNA|nr:hemoglobin subunit alpha-D isoform X1 [Pygocentrus nattereri]
MLSARERELLIELWDRLTPAAEHIGSEALLRMFTTFPKTKTYFAHLDLTARSEHLRSIGKRIVEAIAEGTRHIGTAQFTANLSYLSRFHAYQLRIHPTNFKLFNHCMLVTLACYLGEDFSPRAHAATDKYLSAYAAVLAEKFR